MAETFGVIAGVASLAGLFTSCIDCFEYIHFAKTFGTDYERCLLKADVLGLRLSRWGAAVGIGRSGSHYIAVATADELNLAKAVLKDIIESFNDIKEKSSKFQQDPRNTKNLTLGSFDPVGQLSRPSQGFHTMVQETMRQRQQGASLLQKTKWALFERKKFDRLIDDISEFMDTLENVFPPTLKARENLCQTELAQLRPDTDTLVLLTDVAGKDDLILTEGIQKLVESKRNLYQDFEIKTESGSNHRVGIDYENVDVSTVPGTTFKGFKISGSGSTHVGQRFSNR